MDQSPNLTCSKFKFQISKFTQLSTININTSGFNSKVSELENKIKTAEQKPDITNLATKSSVTAVKNKIPDVKGFVKKNLLCNRNN